MRNRALPLALAIVAVAAVASGCDGDGSPSVEPTRSLTVEPTRTPSLPSPTRTATRPTDGPTDGPTTEPTTEPTEPTTEPTEPTEPPTTQPTRPPTTTPTTEPTEPTEPTTEPAQPTEEPTSAQATPSAEPTPDGDASDAAADEGADDGMPGWGWLLVALAVLAIAGIPLLVVVRRRRRWRADLSEAEGEVAWLARDLLPEMRDTGTREGAAGAWRVAGAERAAAVEDRLTVLEPSAPGPADRARVTALRDAVRAARSRVELALAPTTTEPVWSVLDAVVADLEQALRPPTPEGAPGPS